LPLATTQGRQIPDRLGAGFLFFSLHTSDTPVWRADTWTSDLEPWVQLTEQVSEVAFGFDRIYLLLAQTEGVLALDAQSGKVMDPGPLPASPGYSALAFVDEWFAAAATDVRGVQVSFDAGGSWHPTGIRSGMTSLKVEGETIRVESEGRAVRLTQDGRLEAITNDNDNSSDNAFAAHLNERFGALPTEALGPSQTSRPLGEHPVLDATLHGWALGDGTAYVATRGALGRVDLETGRVLEVQGASYPGVEPCQAVEFGSGVGFVCSERDRGTQIYQVTHTRKLKLAVSFRTARFVSPSGNGRLVIRGPCDDAAPSEPSTLVSYCILSVDAPKGQESAHGLGQQTSRQEIRVRGDLGSERVVALRDGRVAVLIPPRLGSAGVLNLIDDGRTTQVPLKLQGDETTKNLLNAGLWLHGIQQISDTHLGTWVAAVDEYRGVRLGLDGSVEAPKGTGSAPDGSAFSGGYALDITRARETHDYGFEWHDVELPPGVTPWDYKHLKIRAASRPKVGCSNVGCVYGDWLRIGRGERKPTQASATAALLMAPTPPRTASQGNAYSAWRMQCFLTSHSGGAPKLLEHRLGSQAAGRPRRGLAVGFLPSALGVIPSSTDVDGTAYTAFLGVGGPAKPSGGFGFDIGADGAHQFRAYAWGPGGSAWKTNSAWVVRVANQFDLESQWSTTPTQTPWIDLVEAGQTFGADRANRYGTSWSLELDPDERAGVVRVNARGSNELHFVEQNKPIVSLSGARTSKLSGVVQVAGRTYWGDHEGNQFRILRLDSGQAEPVASLPLSATHRGTLIRSSDNQRLALHVASQRGTWHIFPISESGTPEAPLDFSRERLNQQAPPCHPSAKGWLVSNWLPLTRLTPSAGGNVLEFHGANETLRGTQVIAKLLLNQDKICVSALAAQAADDTEVVSHAVELPPEAGVPLVFTDRRTNRRHEFRCTP
jgi:hypothetical protein